MSIASEEWRPIVGHPFYEVSSEGRVRSLGKMVKHFRGGVRKTTGRVLKSGGSSSQYASVMLDDRKTYLVHRLVGKAFPEICGEWFDGCEIDHINTVRNDNRACNLRVCTRHQNHLNPITRARYSDTARKKRLGKTPWNKGKKLTECSGANHWRTKPVYQVKSGKIISVFDSVVQAAEQTGILRTSIYNNISGRSSHAGGYLWGYNKEALLCR